MISRRGILTALAAAGMAATTKNEAILEVKAAEGHGPVTVKVHDDWRTDSKYVVGHHRVTRTEQLAVGVRLAPGDDVDEVIAVVEAALTLKRGVHPRREGAAVVIVTLAELKEALR